MIVNDDANCPWCRRKVADPHELEVDNDRHADINCGWCEKPYRLEATVTVDYFTQKLDADGEIVKDPPLPPA